MRKGLLLFFIMLLSSGMTFAAYLVNHPVEVKQPDGTVLHLFATGDEFHRRVHDAAGYTLVRDPQSGFVTYAVLRNNKLESSGIRYGSYQLRSSEIVPGIDIPDSEKLAKRKAFQEKTPQKPSGNRAFQVPNLRSATTFTKPRANISGPSNAIGSNTGTLQNIVIYIKFQDSPGFTASASAYDDMFNKTGTNVSSMNTYFKAASYEDLDVRTTFYPTPSSDVISNTYVDSHSRGYYQPYNAAENPEGYKEGESADREWTLLKNAVDAVGTSIPPTINTDMDDDSYVDNICFVVQGASDGWSDLLWAHRWALQGGYVAMINGKQVWDYNFMPEDEMKTSTLCHEMMHTFGAPDLYSYTGEQDFPIGAWDLMGLNTEIPQSTSAHIKEKYGLWVDDIPEIPGPGTYTLHDSWTKPNPGSGVYNAWKITSPTSTTDEFFLIEYRNKSNFKESGIPGGGLVIFRITPSANGNGDAAQPFEQYVYRPGGTLTDKGNLSNANFSSNTGRVEFSDYTSPNAFLGDGSLGLDGIAISNISASGGTTMTFNVDYPVPVAPNATAATNVNYGSFTANWSSVSVASGYLLSVYYKESGKNIYVLEDFPVGRTTHYDVDNLDRDVSTTYYYSLKSIVGGTNSSISNEVTVTLNATLTGASGCNDLTNIQAGETPTTTNYGSDGFMLGPNIFGDRQFAEYFQLTNASSTVKGVTINAGFVQNSTGTGKITLRIWGESSGLPGAVIYEQNVPLSGLSVGNNLITFDSPVTVGSSFFIGYEVYYATSGPTTDLFAAAQAPMRNTGGLNTLYSCFSDGRWEALNSVDNWGPENTSSMAISLEVCSDVYYVKFGADATSGCGNLAVQFSNSSQSLGGGNTWLWDFGDTQTSTLETPQHTYAAPGNYDVSLTVTNAFGSKTKTVTGFIKVGTMPVITPSVTNATSGNNGAITITVTGSSNYSIVWTDDALATTEQRTNLAPGNYIVTVTDNDGGCSASETITVGSDKTVTEAMITVTAGTYTYNGSQLTPAFTVKDGTTDLALNTDYENVVYGDNINAGTGAGSITITGKGAYSGTATKTFDIAKAPITATPTADNKEYDRTKVATLTWGTLTGVISADIPYVSLSADAEFADENVATGITVTITSAIDISGDKSANYEAPAASSITGLTADITPAAYTYSISSPQNMLVGHTLADIAAPSYGEGVELAGDKEQVAGTLSWFTDAIRATPATNDVFASANPTLQLYWKFETNNGNYTPSSKEDIAIFNVKEGAPQVLQFTIPAEGGIIERTYGIDGTFDNPATNTSEGGSASITYASSNTSVATVDNSGLVTILGAGSTDITATAAMVPGTYTASDISYTLKVNPRPLTGAVVTVGGAYIYTGAAQVPLPADVTVTLGTTTVASAEYIITVTEGGTNAGPATATVTAATPGNYTGTATGTFNVAKKAITIDAASSTVAGKSYDNSVAAGITVEFSGLEAAETLAENTDYTVANAQFNSANVSEANTVTATIQLIEDGPVAKNYTLADGSFSKAATIAQASINGGVYSTYEVKTSLAKDYVFDLTTLLPNVTGSLGNVTYSPAITTNNGVLGALNYSSGTTLTLPVLSVAAAGMTETVTVDISSDNYNTFASVITVTTIDKTPVTINVTMNGGVYKGSAYTPSAPVILSNTDGSTVTGITLEYLYEDGAGYSSDVAPVNVGNYTLTLSVPASNADYAGSAVFNFSITKRPVQIVADNKSITEGDALPTYTWSVRGGIAGETVLAAGTPAVSSQGANTVGSYPIIVDVTSVTLTSNYIFDTPPAVNGTLTVYPATVNPPLSGDATLYSLTVSEGTLTPGFSPYINDYTVNVGREVERITIWGAANDANASVWGDGEKTLLEGVNIFTITVQAEDGSTNYYEVVVIRSTGVANDEVNGGTLSISFDPAYTVLYIQSGEVVKSATIYDLAGGLQLRVQPGVSGTISVPVAQLTSTAYILRIETGKGMQVLKFVKK